MLTLRAIINATRQMASYGELRPGALDHLASRLTGFQSQRRRDVAGKPDHKEEKATSSYVRRWDEKKGAYIYTKR
jgi:hypothetical protein